MKHSVTILFLLISSTYLLAQQDKSLCPQVSTLTIDGKSDDWPMAWVVDEEKIFSYNVCADEQNLYVRVMTEDFYAKRKMAVFGFTLWIDPNGKKKKKLGLRFPVGGAEAEERMNAIREEGGPGNSAGEKAEFQKKADQKLIENVEILELIGLADEPITSARSGIMNGIKVAISMDATGAYIYEAIIPFKSYRISRASIEELSVGFETGKYVVPKKKPDKKATIDNTLTPNQMSRMQGYGSLMTNPNLAYTASAWTSIKLK
jgi:hypothetical protein